MRVVVSAFLCLALTVPAFAGEPSTDPVPMPRWTRPWHQRNGCVLRLVAAAAVGAGLVWAAGGFHVTKPDEPVPSQPLPDDAPRPPQQFPPPNVGDALPDLP